MAKLEQREIVHSNVIDSAWPKNRWHAKTRDFRIRDSTGRFWATSRRSSIPSSHPILKGHRSASVVLMDTCGRYDSHSRTEDMLREFRFKWSGRDTGQVKVDCRSDFFFCGETLPKRSQAEALPTIPCLLTAMTSWTCWGSYKMILQALEQRAKFLAKTNVRGCSAPRVRSLASKALL